MTDTTPARPEPPYKVLIVDDSFIMRKLVGEIVESDTDFQICGFAENGKIALQMVRQLKPDIVLLDIEMPEMSGLETLRRLGLRSPCPVVILSSRVGASNAKETLEALRLGAVATIGKPSGAVSLDLKQKRASEIIVTLRKSLGLTAPKHDVAVADQSAADDRMLHHQIAPVLEGLPCGVLLFDGSWRLRLANERAARLLNRNQFAANEALSAIFDESNADIAANLRDAVSGTGPAEFEADFIAAEGDWIALRLSVKSFAGDGGDRRHIVAISDIARERHVEKLLAQTQSQAVAEAMVLDGGLALRGQMKRTSILFADIRGFTTLSETLGAERIVALLNDYFSFMADIIRDRRGVIDKFIGDAIMAVFGVPTANEHDAGAAVAAARAMIGALELLNERRQESQGGPIRIGIGVATGHVVAGTIGSPDRMNYTVIGDAANLASRLEGLTKPYGAAILACGATVAALAEPVPMRQVDVIRVKGQEAPTDVFEIFTVPPEGAVADGIEVFRAGFRAYRGGDFRQAEATFERSLQLNPTDTMAGVLKERCRSIKRRGDWDGVWTALEK